MATYYQSELCIYYSNIQRERERERSHILSIPLTWTRDTLGPLISLLLYQWIYYLPCLLTQQEILEELLQDLASMDVKKTVILLRYHYM